jgi:hypothetical protein
MLVTSIPRHAKSLKHVVSKIQLDLSEEEEGN